MSFSDKLEQSLTIARTLDSKGPPTMPPSPGTVPLKHTHSKVHKELVLGLNAVLAEAKFRVSELKRERQWAQESAEEKAARKAKKAEAKRKRQEERAKKKKEKEEGGGFGEFDMMDYTNYDIFDDDEPAEEEEEEEEEESSSEEEVEETAKGGDGEGEDSEVLEKSLHEATEHLQVGHWGRCLPGDQRLTAARSQLYFFVKIYFYHSISSEPFARECWTPLRK